MKPPIEIQKSSFCRNLVYCDAEERRYKKMLSFSESSVVRQLDLANFLQRQRMLMLAMMTMLRPHSLTTIRNLSALYIDDSSELEDNSDDQVVKALREQVQFKLDLAVSKTMNRPTLVDKRLATLLNRK